MQSNRVRAVAGVAVIVIAVLLLIVLHNGSEGGTSSDAGGRTPTIVVRNAKPVGGVAQLTFDKGERIRFKVESDVADEVHFHGYDVGKDVAAGGSVTFDVPATIEGRFEVELEGRKEQIAEITVNP
jgi:hypothetical protein